MADKSKSSNPTLMLMLLVLALEVAALFFRSEDSIQHDLAIERDELTSTIGSHATAIVDRADSWFGEWFVDSGLTVETMRLLSPAEHVTEKFEADLNANVLAKTEDTGRAVWTGVYLAVHRLVVALVFLPLLLIFGAASTFDGWQQRKIKILGFAQSSPQTYGVARSTNAILLLLPPLYLFAPAAIPVIVIPAWMTLLGLCIQLQTAHVPRI